MDVHVLHHMMNLAEKLNEVRRTETAVQPSEEFELTADSLGAHKLILRTLSYLTVNSHDDSH